MGGPPIYTPHHLHRTCVHNHIHITHTIYACNDTTRTSHHIYSHTHHTHTHNHIAPHRCIYTDIYTHTHTHTQPHTTPHVYTHTTHVYIHAHNTTIQTPHHIYSHTHYTYIHIHITTHHPTRVYIQTHARAHTDTHTRALAQCVALSIPAGAGESLVLLFVGFRAIRDPRVLSRWAEALQLT